MTTPESKVVCDGEILPKLTLAEEKKNPIIKVTFVGFGTGLEVFKRRVKSSYIKVQFSV